MKTPSMVSFLITLLLAAAVCIQGQEPVKDTSGNDLKTGQKYFIQPVKTNGGGLVPAPPIDILHACPLGVVQTLLPFQPGLPVSFSFPDTDVETTVNTNDSPNIEFQSDIWPFCTEFSKFWKVNDSSSATQEPPLLIAGTPGKQNSGFKIENAGEGAGANTYKFTTFIGPVGTKSGFFNAPALVLTNDKAKQLVVKFKKVDDATSATTSTSPVDKLGLRMFPF
ncbi:Kunitz trypsin inhibitor 2 [Cardamine amara subsp. amara]|uniref:Kunitz trypsin inhibitor 2 n=1 Tax=Cardamine amara subsp. amara TaxID=228776 RepID=A0ABD1BRL9_CARAN